MPIPQLIAVLFFGFWVKSRTISSSRTELRVTAVILNGTQASLNLTFDHFGRKSINAATGTRWNGATALPKTSRQSGPRLPIRALGERQTAKHRLNPRFLARMTRDGVRRRRSWTKREPGLF